MYQESFQNPKKIGYCGYAELPFHITATPYIFSCGSFAGIFIQANTKKAEYYSYAELSFCITAMLNYYFVR
ncbi:hypothetical protein A6769_34395 [Nostoc punctiforme NIES-2108]|uniref:Uncharacterized protein n=1 Tax=Nostoc punctiforme NIES-2108 TaxID=1356359 RepID=A0A367R1R2_NOSPU|nr:hypothetical protein A6769_34395 [Nostoc punctiforme NIES-2108]